MLKLNFSNAETTRKDLTEEQQQQITKMYSSLAKDINKEIKKAPRVPSDALRKQYLQGLAQQINTELNSMRGEMQQTIESTMLKTANSVVKDNLDFLRSIGMPIEGAFSHVPAETVRIVATGQLYDGNWTLARQLWKHSVHTQRDVNAIVAKGIAANKSAYDIAKDLEKYVDPKATKDWEWSKVYPGTARKVDYNAQRLARTMVSHAYQQAFVRTTQKNPFVTKYRWEASNSARVCEICADRDGKLFDKDDLPLDHPNGMCTFTAVMEQSLEDVADRLADWAHGEEDPELETWGKDLFGDRWGQPPAPKQTEYKYHATKRSNVVSIIEKGLKPSRGHIGNGVYFANNTEDALWWTAETSTGGKTLFRVALDYLKPLGYEEYSASESGYDVAEGLVDAKIPFDKIEIKVGDNEWWSLSQYAKNYKNSIYNNLSSSAQKRVDKQYSKETKEWLKKRANG